MGQAGSRRARFSPFPAGESCGTVGPNRDPPPFPFHPPTGVHHDRPSAPVRDTRARFLCAGRRIRTGQEGYEATWQEAPEENPKRRRPADCRERRLRPARAQVLDFWQAKSDKPTPLVFCIHGGGWSNGDKSSYYGSVKTFLDNGISVVTINYRLMKQANEQKVMPPVKAPLEDAARALQFVRSKADGVEHRQEADRRHRRLGRRLLVALAGLPRRHGRPQEHRPGRPRIDPPVLRRGRRGPGHRSTRRCSASGCRTTPTAPTPSA